MKEKPVKIIFVNSFKGGAGKTTLSLSHCITGFSDPEKYDNIVYMDLDLLGTGTRYLFDENNVPEDKCFDQTGRSVLVKIGSGKEMDLHLAYLTASYNGRFVLGGPHFAHHQGIIEEMLKQKVLKFIRAQISKPVKTMIVLDCAPGFAEMEQNILKECYNLAKQGKVEIEEEYVATLDSAHVRKCIQCLQESREIFEVPQSIRKIKMVINDMQNYEGYLRREGKNVTKEWEKIANEIKAQFSNMKVTLMRWKYSEGIAVKSTYLYERKLENQIDDYILTSANYSIIGEKGK